MSKDPGSNYEVREQIGKGAFGAAFLVVDKETKKEYVLKRVRLARQTPWQRQSTMQEMELVSSFRHPFIVPHNESWVQGGHTVNIVYGYCEKGDLASLLHKQKGSHFPETQLLVWLAELLLALDYMHNMKVLHRDIKCSNIFLTARGDVQIGDFGLATFRDTGDANEDQSLVGTPHYMSPELLSNKGYSFKTDVWSLGCVMYELSALKPAFNAFNIQGLIDKIKKNKPPPITAPYSNEWITLVSRMLHKSPERRPSVRQLLQAPILRDAVLATMSYIQDVMPGVPMPNLDTLSSSSPTAALMRTISLTNNDSGSDNEDTITRKYTRSMSHSAVQEPLFLKELRMQDSGQQHGDDRDGGGFDSKSPTLGKGTPLSPGNGSTPHWRQSSSSFDSDIEPIITTTTAFPKRTTSLPGDKKPATVMERMGGIRPAANTPPPRKSAVRSSLEHFKRQVDSSDEEADESVQEPNRARRHRAVSAPPRSIRRQEKGEKAERSANSNNNNNNSNNHHNSKQHNPGTPGRARRVASSNGETQPEPSPVRRSAQAWPAKVNGRHHTPERCGPPGLHTAARAQSRQKHATTAAQPPPAAAHTQQAATDDQALLSPTSSSPRHNFIMPVNSATTPAPAHGDTGPGWVHLGNKASAHGKKPDAGHVANAPQHSPSTVRVSSPARAPHTAVSSSLVTNNPLVSNNTLVSNNPLAAPAPISTQHAEGAVKVTPRQESKDQDDSPTGNTTPPVTDRVSDHTTPRQSITNSLAPTPRSVSSTSEHGHSLPTERLATRVSESAQSELPPSEHNELVSWHMQAIIRHMSSVMTLASLQPGTGGNEKADGGEQVFHNVIFDEDSAVQAGNAAEGGASSGVPLRTLSRLLQKYMPSNNSGQDAAATSSPIDPRLPRKPSLASSVNGDSTSPLPALVPSTSPQTSPAHSTAPPHADKQDAPADGRPPEPSILSSANLQNMFRMTSNAEETHSAIRSDSVNRQSTNTLLLTSASIGPVRAEPPQEQDSSRDVTAVKGEESAAVGASSGGAEQPPAPVITQELWAAQQHKFLFMQRVLGLVLRLYARQRYHELGNVLSSPLLSALGVNPIPLPTGRGTADNPSTSPAALFNIGDFVFVGSRRRMKGVIRYFGPSHWDNEDWVGLQFEEAVPFQGKTNGTVGGIRYFDAPQHCGLFVKATTLKPEHERGSVK